MWHPVQQNSDEPCPCCGKTWMDLRAGKITGSPPSIGVIMANYGKSFGDPAKRLAVDIAAVECGGRTTQSGYTNNHMERGHEEEPIARKKYEDYTFVDVSNGGFYDNGITGCSPDGRILDSGLAEIKSVSNPYHFACIKRNSYDPKYKWQLFFNLKESGREWIDYISYCGTFPSEKSLFVKRVLASESTEEFAMIDQRVSEFRSLVDKNKAIIMRYR